MDLVVPEVAAGVAELQEHRVCERLPRERGAGSPEGDRHLVLGRNGQDLLDLLLCVHLQWCVKLSRQCLPEKASVTLVTIPRATLAHAEV